MKKPSDKNTVLPFYGGGSTLPLDTEIQMEQALSGLTEMLSETDDPNIVEESFSEIMGIAEEIAKKNWGRACEVVKQAEESLSVDILGDDIIMGLIDLALDDPQIGKMTKAVNICMPSYNFKQLADVDEIKGAMPKEGALALLDIAELYTGSTSQLMQEIYNMKNAIDPSFSLPEGEGFDWH
ncbi:MAG: hypothetical protein ACRBDL_05175 [Alphaproteobacteria bacterium]